MAVVDSGDFRRLIKTRLLVRSQWSARYSLAPIIAHQRSLIAVLLQNEMLGSIAAAGAADWSVLIMDPVSTRVMSHACQISEILDFGISCESLL